MAPTGPGTLLGRRNVKLDSFLKRNTERSVYERIRATEPCVVISETVNKVYMHVVLSDELVYLTEYPPRTLHAAVSFGRVRDIELVNDLPLFLSGKDREQCQHIRITYVTDKPAAKGRDWLRRDKGAELPHPPPSVASSSSSSSRRNSHCPGYPVHRDVGWRTEQLHVLKSSRSASCPNPETLGLLKLPHPPPLSSPSSPPPSGLERNLKTLDGVQASRTMPLVLTRLLRRDVTDGGVGEREAELHLYATTHTSRLYLHLQNSWNSFIIRSTLLLDPLYRRRFCVSCDSAPGRRHPVISWERTAHLFSQLTSELLQDGISVESLYLLLQELRTAAHRSVAVRKLFWRSSEVCDFLVQTLEETLHRQSLSVTADQLLLKTLIVQTLSVMFRETEVEASRLQLLSAKNGALVSRMLLASISDPRLQTQSHGAAVDPELQSIVSEYLDSVCSLLFELLLLGHETSSFSVNGFLSVGWILDVVQTHPHLLPFMDHQVQQLVLVLSDPQDSTLSPLQSVLLFQRCRLLLVCLQHSSFVSQHLRSNFREDFRYRVKPSRVREKLPPRYPITSPTLQLVDDILTLVVKR